MVSRKKRFFQGLAVDAVGMPLTMLLGLLLIPLYFNYISKSEYGYWTTLFELFFLLGLFGSGIDLYIIQTVVGEDATGKNITQKKISSIVVVIALIIIISVLGVLVVFFILPKLNLAPTGGINGDLIFLLLTFFLLISLLSQNINSIIVGQNKVGLSNFFTYASRILIQLGIILFLFLGFGLLAFPISYLGVTFLFFLFLIIYLWPFLRDRISFQSINKNDFKDSISFASKSLLGRASHLIYNNTDAIIIAKFLSTIEVTIYVLTMKLTNVFKYISGRVVSIGYPAFTQLMAGKDFGRLQEIILKFFRFSLRLGFFFSFVIFFLNESFVENWVGKDKYGSFILTLLFSIICFRESLFPIFSSIIFSTKDIRDLNFIFLFESLLNLLLSVILVKILKLEGVALATVISSCFLSLAYGIYKVNKLTHLKYRSLLKSLFTVSLKSIPSIAILGMGNLYLQTGFAWWRFFSILIIAGFFNILFFEGKFLYQFKSLPAKEILNKIIDIS